MMPDKPPPALILVVEDDPGVAALEATAAEDVGCEVVTAATGARVMEVLRERQPTLMLLDYSLPDTTGMSLLDRIRDEGLRCPPFIVATGGGDEYLAVELMRRGALNYLVKDHDFLNALPVALEGALREIDLQRRLDAAESRLRLAARVLEGTSEAVFVTDQQHRITDINAAFEQITGYGLDQVAGQTPAIFLPTDAASGAAIATVVATLDEVGQWQGELAFQPRQGGRRTGLFAISRITRTAGEAASFVTLFSDISRRKADEEALLESQAFVQAVLDSVSNQIAVIDHEARIINLNEAWRRFARESGEQSGPISAAAGIGANYLDICSTHIETSGNEVGVCEGIQGVLDGDLSSYSIEYPWHAPKTRRWFTMTVTPLGAGKKGAVIAHANITERKEAELQVTFMAYHDKLTDLPNRSLFFDRFSAAITQARRNDKHLGLLFIDLDGFKAVNDTCGHEAGDIVLRVVAQRLQAAVRAMDTVARMGGDEFVIILGEMDSAQHAGLVAAKIVESIKPPVGLPDGQSCQVGASIGISVYPDHGTEMDTLLAAADEAMYQSKHRGKGSYTYATQSPPETGGNDDWVVIDENHLMGIRELDDQHRHLATLLNGINAAIRENADAATVKSLFEAFAAATSAHFGCEQAMMDRHAYPDAKGHAMQHVRAEVDTLHYRSSLYKGGDLFVLQSIKDWLLHHILMDDKPLGRFLRDKGLT